MRYWKFIPPMKALLAVEATARHGSFSKAAAELNITQSAVSHLVTQAENFLTVPLFDRASRPVRLTTEGMKYVNAMVSSLNLLKAEGQSLQSRKTTNSITISCNLAYGNFWLLPKLKSFHALYPDITVNMVTAYQGLPELSEGIDVALRFGKGEWPGCTAIPLFREQIVPVASGRYLEGMPPIKRPEDLLQHTLLHADAQDKSWFDWGQWFDYYDVRHPARLGGPRFDNHVMMMQAALTEGGVALGWIGTASEFVRLKQLEVVLADRLNVNGGVYLVTRADSLPSPELSLFAAWIVGQAIENCA
jgi:LysR family glycine cleavage system transcriptional activator